MKLVLTGVSLVAIACAAGCSGDARNADSSALRADSATKTTGIGASTGTSTGVASGRVTSADSLARLVPPSGQSSNSNAARTGNTSTNTRGSASTRSTRPGGTRTAMASDSVRRDTGISRSDAADTARGIVAVVGTSFDSRVIVRSEGGSRPITLVGAQAKTVGAMSGADVWVSGTRDDNGRITVSRFAVRAVDGAPALDGTLIARGQQLLLVTRDGKQHAIGAAPGALREHVGARVWVAGPLDKGPITFGVIEERR